MSRRKPQTFDTEETVYVSHVKGAMKITAEEAVKASLEVRPYQITVFGVFDATTNKLWSGGFYQERDAVLAKETAQTGVVNHCRRKLEITSDDREARRRHARALLLD